MLHREPTTVSVIFIGGFSNVSRMWKRPLNWSCVDCLSLCISFSWYYERREMCTICYITTSEPFITKIRAPWITDCLWKLSLFRILSIHSWATTPFWVWYSEMEIYIQLKWLDKNNSYFQQTASDTEWHLHFQKSHDFFLMMILCVIDLKLRFFFRASVTLCVFKDS